MRPVRARGSGGASPTPNGGSPKSSSSKRLKDQRQVLEKGFGLVKPGGRLVYITCSVLPEENTDQVAAFPAAPSRLQDHSVHGAMAQRDRRRTRLHSADGSQDTLLLTPARHGTDGFFVAVMRQGLNGLAAVACQEAWPWPAASRRSHGARCLRNRSGPFPALTPSASRKPLHDAVLAAAVLGHFPALAGEEDGAIGLLGDEAGILQALAGS